MKIFINGATGSLGAYLVRYFSEKGHEIIASGKAETPPENLLKYATYTPLDINQPFEIPSADVFIHTAALSDDAGAWKDFQKANVEGTLNALNASKQCKFYIHVSSSSVYLPDNNPLTEEMAGKQNNKQLSFYGASKLASEKEVLKHSKHEKCFILRPRALYGEGDKKILPRMLHLVKKDKIFRPGKMQINVSMTHYQNMAHAVECCLNSEMNGIHTYNVADDKSYVLIDVLRKFTKSIYGYSLAEKTIPIGLLKLLAVFHLGGMTPLLIRALTKDMELDISKIKQELNYQPGFDLENSLDEIKNWVDKIGGAEVLKKADKKLAWDI